MAPEGPASAMPASAIDIPLYQPDLGGNERSYVLECLDTSWISSKGAFCRKFEQAFADYVGARYATSVSNGTVALHLALLSLGIGRDDEVLVPSLTYVAAVNAITYTGARPVFVDSLSETWQMDPEDARRKITPRTRAILPVHLYGHPCDMPALTSIAGPSVFVIEDCAEAFGSRIGNRHVGSFANIAAYSFYGNKTITTGEGGMLTTDDKTLYDRAVHFKMQGLAAHREYWHDVVGYNYRMTNICAAIGLAQLERANIFLARKRAIAAAYQRGIAGLPLKFHAESPGVTHSFWMSSILVDDPTLRDPLRDHLRRRGIETRPVFYPVHTMPMYSARFERLPIAESLGWRGINIPSWPGLSDDQVQIIIGALRDFYARR